MQRGYEDYKNEVRSRIKRTVQDLNSQPVLFIGTGLSIRYFGAPNWENLLRDLSDNEAINRDYEYYEQRIGDKKQIAGEFAEMYNEWAWEKNAEDESGYPPWVFDSEAPSDIYLKYTVADQIRDITPSSSSELSEKDKREIDLLEEIQPHAVITTNYDTFLEDFVFPEYERVIGQTLIEEPFANIGEIFKIHGCVTSPTEIVLTDSDYNKFDEKKPYLSAKLLAFFTEHPILIVGYRPDDPNVKRILSDVNAVLSDTDRRPNIFLVNWESDISESDTYNQEKLIDVGGGEHMTVNYIVTDDFDWLFEAFSESGEISGVNSKLLRKLLRNTYDIIYEEAPRREISVGRLETVADDKERLLDILGISPLDGDSPSGREDGEPATIAEAGVPVGQIISNEEVENLEQNLQVAVDSWERYDLLFEQRAVIYTFYSQREDLDLTDIEIEFLFRSSLNNIMQGSEWLLRYDDEIDNLLENVTDILDGRSVAAFERDLLALGKEELLNEIAETELGDSAMSNAETYSNRCNEPAGDRIKEYTGEVIRFNDSRHDVDSLLTGSTNLSELLDDIISNLIEDDESDGRRALRKVELVRIANSPLCPE